MLIHGNCVHVEKFKEYKNGYLIKLGHKIREKLGHIWHTAFSHIKELRLIDSYS